MKDSHSKIIDYDGREDLEALRWLPLAAARARRPVHLPSVVNLKFRNANEVGLPINDEAAWMDLCNDIKGSPLYDGFVRLGQQVRSELNRDNQNGAIKPATAQGESP
jgi:hypothetical protein